MMSPDNLTNKEESGTSQKAATTTRPAELQALKCPRCDSPNTKFCYYNNYSHTQPRHFCKTCRRYWTKGGALRNIPIGGGCRKNKKISSKSSNSSRFSSGGDSKDSAGSSPYFSDMGGLKFFNGISPGMNFQLGGLGLNNNFSRILHSSSNTTGASNSYNQHHGQLISSFGEMISSSSSCFGIDPSGNSSSTNNLMGFNFPFPSSVLKQDRGNGAGGIFLQDHNTTNSNLASSIESLSTINQDLHWKLQQERLAMLFDDQTQAPQKPQPILFQNLDSSKPDAVVGNSRKDNNNNNNNGSIGIGPTGNLATEWFFGSSNYSAAVNSTPTNSSSTGNGIQAWSNFYQYTPLP